MSNKPTLTRGTAVEAAVLTVIKPTHKRRELDIMTALLCLTVIYIHVAGEAAFSYERASLQYALAYNTFIAATYVVPAFIFLAAVKFSLSLSRKSFGYGRFMLSRLRFIFLPYVLWNVAYYAYFLHRRYFPPSLADLGRYIAVGDLSGQFYFIVIIMQFYILAPVWHGLSKIKTGGVIAIAAAAAVPSVYIHAYTEIPYTDRLFTTYLPFWLLGVAIGANYEKALEILRRGRIALFAVTLAWGGVHLYYNYLHSLSERFYVYVNQMQMAYNVLATLSVLAVCRMIDVKWIYAVCARLSDASYYIFLSHCLVLTDARIRMTDAGITAVTTRLAVAAAAAYTIPIILSVAYVKLKQGIIKKPST
jgi:membrane-bound acyltransferase YfiQ involved in biofilm formation